ncbi:MAG: hypothetical protein M0P39_06925 [Rhodocyclaceae bacterium]|jgi:hypothetical protein|nr:hypothetical protein [Rhodocyclaceae bacterium]
MIDAIASSTASPSSGSVSGGRPTQTSVTEAPPPREEAKPAEITETREESTKVSLSGKEAEPNTADFNAKPVQQYQAVSALR